ncbi:MAG: ABC transporter ATP-binding protein [Planctomycetota bacterium]|nr:MAG: ABC transporter ATP-binding protein [Planctomycetota bacterium]
MKVGAFSRSLSYFPRIRRRWMKGMLCVLPSSGLEIAVPLIVREVYGGIRRGDMSLGMVAAWSSLALLLVLIKGAAKFGMRWYITGASREFEQHFRQDLFAHLMTLSPRDVSHVRTGDIMSRSTADVEAVRLMLGPGVMYVSQAIVIVPGALIAMALIDPVLMLAMLVPFVGLATVIRLAAPPTQRWSQATQERLAEISTVAQENISGIRVVKAFAREAVSSGDFRKMGTSLFEANLRLATLRGLTAAAITAVKEFGVLVILVLGGLHIVDGNMQPEDMFFFLMVLNIALWPLIAIGWMLGMYHRGKAGAERLEELFALQPSVQEAAEPRTPETTRGALEVRDLTHAFDGAPVLQNVSFKVPAGATLGITGRTGCGKTTLVQLLARLIEPPPGTVFIDGVDVRDLPLDWLRKTIGVVPQDTFLFSETIHDNIAFAGEHVDREQVLAAARLAHIHDDIEGFPTGYEQELGERGVTLSGGQRQRTAIARTLAARPPVMVLDDCLSAVDSVTEQNILRQLRGALAERTAVIVSHRVSALSLADHVIVLDEGRVEEAGSHEDLLARGGLYAELHERQQIEAELDEL